MNYLFRVIRSHPRLYLSIAIGILTGFVVPFLGVKSPLTASILGYNVGVGIYIIMAVQLLYGATPEHMRKRALRQDDGNTVVLFLIVLALIFSVSAIFTDMISIKNLTGAERYEKLILGALTIVASWFFMNMVFALHYAHDYYFELQIHKRASLIFLPENEDPNYTDFLYFSFILGATAQTADVTLASKKMRRTCLLHSILSFFFNATILALTVNMAAGLF